MNAADSVYVLPKQPPHDERDQRPADPILARQNDLSYTARGIALSDFTHCLSGELRAPMRLPTGHAFRVTPSRVIGTPLQSFRVQATAVAIAAGKALWARAREVRIAMRVTPLGVAIGGVLCVRPQPQVGGIHADSIVTGMTYAEASGDGAIRQLPRKSMRPSTRPYPLPESPAIHGQHASGPPLLSTLAQKACVCFSGVYLRGIGTSIPVGPWVLPAPRRALLIPTIVAHLVYCRGARQQG